MNDSVDPAAAAQQAARHPLFERLARLGYVANGILHATLGVLASVVATGGKAQADQSGAMRALSAQPFGVALLWICAIGALLLGLWSLAQLLLPGKKTRERLKLAGTGLVFLAAGFTFGRFGMGNPSDSEHTATSLSGELMKSLAGRAALVALGAVLLVMAGYYIYKGASRKFLDDLHRSSRREISWAVRYSGMIGYPAKGLVLGALGLLFIVATVQGDPEEAGGIDGALKAIRDQDHGSVALGAIAAGLISYALYLILRARYDRMD
ncbi:MULTISPECIES: DUF1206 domain-containing protein [Glutamicibacter]|nr:MULTISPECIES: DUF1206 domain-containing protein [Glutamicibacter]MBF6673500.1 DUF1206 domain-containing protein [Glutamicibacter sp. FBE19]NQD40248.1 DUF1206 domain-containing protein [Glutamicibacter halophytocola]UUX59182.1 DUF1206 domain-containing protein [Glutamicibacter halophytocola]